jgi:hypothetical protein
MQDLAAQWKELSDDDKKEWKEKAMENKLKVRTKEKNGTLLLFPHLLPLFFQFQFIFIAFVFFLKKLMYFILLSQHVCFTKLQSCQTTKI